MTELVDLSAYCARIGFAGPLSPSLKTLRALQRHHIASVPFEALDVLAGKSVDLTPAAVDAKIIERRRGGYCHEQNGLFGRVLRAIGFRVEPLLGRVLWMAPSGARPPRTHMALRVTTGGRAWLVDVAFGANVPPEPLQLDLGGPQLTEFDIYRVSSRSGNILLEARIAERWQSLYLLSAERAFESDIELANWYSATHPASTFRNNLTVALTSSDARHALLNNRLTVRRRDGRTERSILSAAGIERSLRELFHLPFEESWRPALEKAAAVATAELGSDRPVLGAHA